MQTEDIQTGSIIDQFDPTTVQIAKHILVVPYKGPHEKRFDGLRIEHRIYDNMVTRYLKPSKNLKEYDRVHVLPVIEEKMPMNDLSLEAMRIMREVVRNPKEYLVKLKADSQSFSDTDNTGKIKTAPKASDKKASKSKHQSMTDSHNATETVGVLLDHGIAMQKMRKRRFKSYYVDIKVDNLNGATQRLWGADLSRAIKEAHVSKGDRVRLRFEGTVRVSVPTGPKGNKTYVPRDKKAYSIQKL